MSAHDARAPGWLSGNWVALGLWAALVAACARGSVLYVMDVLGHAAEPEIARLRLAATLPGVFWQACALGLTLAVCAALVARALADSPRALRVGALVLVWAVSTWAWLVFLAGVFARDVSRRVGTDTARGEQVTQALAIAAGLLALALVVAVARSARRSKRVGVVGPLIPAALATLLPLGWWYAYGRYDEQMMVRTPIRSLLAAEGAFEVVAENPRGPAHVGVICPSADYRIDGSDMSALVLSPPGEVRIELGPDDGPGWLRARAGVDWKTVRRFGDELEGSALRFEARADGQLVFASDIPIAHVGEFIGTEWVEVGAGQGLPVYPGMELRLRTALVGADGAELEQPPILTAGFGGLTLERRERAERTLSSVARPNVVLIVMDTLRADRLSLYGYERETSPRLDRLAERGLVFDEAHSTASWTWPSTASLLTGLAPEEHGVGNGSSVFLADELTTLAEVMQARGLTTAGWSGNPLIVPDKNFDQGFEFFDSRKRGMRKSPVLLPSALEWIETMGDTRFFLYLHMTDPHAPLAPHPEAGRRFAADVRSGFAKKINDFNVLLLQNRGHGEAGEVRTDDAIPPHQQRWINDLYDACVWSGDHWLGQVLDTLERANLSERTIVAFTSDHGEELFDHGLVTHGHSLHRELVRVPLVIAGPGVPVGARVNTPVSNRHLAPTLARLVGGELGQSGDALDLAALGADPMVAERPVFFSTSKGWWNGRQPQPLYGVRRGSFVLHVAPEGAPWGEPSGESGSTGGQMRLFDLGNDLHETRDVGADRADLAGDLRGLLDRVRSARAARRVTPDIPAGEATLETLRELGYIGDDEGDE
jgi:arylsulfatase A-like enzyme